MGDPQRLVGQSARVGGAHERRAQFPRRRRAAALRRDRAATGRGIREPLDLRQPRRRARRGIRAHPLHAARPAVAPGRRSPGHPQHLGGRVLRPLPAAADRTRRSRRSGSASNDSCSTTAGSSAAATIAPGSATGLVDPSVWPNGLTPLVEHVRGLGMQFGIWFEPEMVNPDSELARAHPEWILSPQHRDAPLARQQLVLNTAHPDAFASPARPDRRASSPNTGSTTSSGTTTAICSSRSTGAPASRACTPQTRGDVPADRRDPRGVPVAGDRVVLRRRRPHRPRHRRPRGPLLDLRLERPTRTAAHPALDEPADAARAARLPRRCGPRARDRATQLAHVPRDHGTRGQLRHRMGSPRGLGGRAGRAHRMDRPGEAARPSDRTGNAPPSGDRARPHRAEHRRPAMPATPS